MVRRLVGLCALVAVGCVAERRGESAVWLPLDAPAPRDVVRSPAPAAAALAAPWRQAQDWDGEGPLELSAVLGMVERSYPLLSAAELARVQAEAKRLAALGEFDLYTGAKASWQPNGFYENHYADAYVEQNVGVLGAQLFGGYRYSSGDFDPTFDGKRVVNHGGEFRAGLRVPLLQDRAIDAARAGVAQAEVSRDQAEAKIQVSRIKFLLEAAKAYWSWVSAGQQRAIAEALLQIAEERQEGVDERVLQGALPAIEGVDNERLVVRRRAGLIAAQRAEQAAEIRLSLFVRGEDGQPVRPSALSLPAAFPPPLAPDLSGEAADATLALEWRPEPQALRLELEQTELELALADNAQLPQLDLSVLASQDLDRSRPTITKGEFEFGAQLEFSLPIQRRKARGRAAYARAELERLELELRFAEDVIRAEVADALSELIASHARAEQTERGMALTQQLADAERERFDLGQSTILVLNLREQAAAEAQATYVKALADYWKAVAEYRAVLGVDGGP